VTCDQRKKKEKKKEKKREKRKGLQFFSSLKQRGEVLSF
jgi:hypothetical protein